MQTNGLYKSPLRKEIIPEEIAPLVQDARMSKRPNGRRKSDKGIKNLKTATIEITQYGVILPQRSTIIVFYTYDMIACHQMVLGTERKRGVYYNRDIPTSKSQLS